ncbi:hypothetical protein [Algoriphagus boritolerans]|uniref:Uncharacterized protein n=1 Tax=Algoriphagus boritolerans DSM 17298 = JCM 18970 TaxID=1120964 RepID=A0A1H6AK98_9BACT|nr:hypothetical protein [Algoriphagus boritolerans]SEG48832.1 hypothetical protein SAMN03080598_04182 [Algoriphagus boritolerans DSM 17298 = JCM 18970]
MKKFNYLLMLFTAATFALTSCGEDEVPDNGVTIEGIPATATIEAGGTLGPVTATATALDGLVSLVITKDGAPLATVPLSGTTASAPFSYPAEPGDAGKNVVFEFTVTDTDGDVAKATHVLTVGAEATTIRITSNLTTSQTWETGKTYILAGRIAVEPGNTLTIEPGVVVKGEVGTGANASALIIPRGAKIEAVGTATQPIIFTTVADELEPGQIASPNLDPELNGLWGGLIVLGRAKGSFLGNTSETQIEGIPASDPNGLFGGDNDADDSGTLKYISIRHGGANIGEGNEINGLTLGSVGSETEVEFVEVIGNQDDGIEWFGGTVDVKNAVVWNAGDDAIDADMAWNGTLDNFIVVNAGDKCFELDGPEGSYVNGNYTMTNGSVAADDAAGLVDNDANTNVDLSNIYFFGIKAGQTFDQTPTVPAAFSNFQVTLPAGTAITDFFLGTSAEATTAVAAGANTVGADKAPFAGWSWTAVSGALDDFK